MKTRDCGKCCILSSRSSCDPYRCSMNVDLTSTFRMPLFPTSLLLPGCDDRGQCRKHNKCFLPQSALTHRHINPCGWMQDLLQSLNVIAHPVWPSTPPSPRPRPSSHDKMTAYQICSPTAHTHAYGSTLLSDSIPSNTNTHIDTSVVHDAFVILCLRGTKKKISLCSIRDLSCPALTPNNKAMCAVIGIHLNRNPLSPVQYKWVCSTRTSGGEGPTRIFFVGALTRC